MSQREAAVSQREAAVSQREAAAGAVIIARSVHGLEWIAADEIALRFPAVRGPALTRRELTFRVPVLDPELLRLRTVDDAFLQVGRVESVGTARDVPALLAKAMAGLDFPARLAQLRQIRADIPGRPAFDVVASLEGRRNYNRFAVENAVGAALATVLRGSYLERSSAGRQAGEPDLTVRVLLRDTTAIAALRLGRRPLHRREYKQDTGPGTLHPPMAAALGRLAATAGVVLDPFCGDGTVVIESALSYPDTLALGSDLDPVRLANARGNAQRAGARTFLVRADAAHPVWRPGHVDALVTNPPWNVAVAGGGKLKNSLNPLWSVLPGLLAPDGRICLIADAGLDAPESLRRLGYAITVRSQIRLAGRLSHLVLCAPPGRAAPQLSHTQTAWRNRSIEEGLLTEDGF